MLSTTCYWSRGEMSGGAAPKGRMTKIYVSYLFNKMRGRMMIHPPPRITAVVAYAAFLNRKFCALTCSS